MATIKDRRQSPNKARRAPQTVSTAQWGAEPVWKLLRYQSEADYEMLANATECHLCGRPLPKFHRYRVTPPLEAPPGGWLNKFRANAAEVEHRTGEADLAVCNRCKMIIDLGGWPIRQHPAELLQGRLFD